MKTLLIVFFACLLFKQSCSHSKTTTAKTTTMDESKIVKIIYSYKDSSEPPRFHRSYDLTITAKQIEMKEDSYGDILSEESRAFNTEDFKKLTSAFIENKLANRTIEKGEGCTGGSNEYIKLFDENNEILFKGYVYHCGGNDYGDLSGNYKDYFKLIKTYK